MLKHWQTHAEYQQFISEAVASLNPSQLKKLHSMSDSWCKLTSLTLDPVGEFLAPFYSNTARPALNQPQILRSFVLMLDRKFTSLTRWTEELMGDDLLAMIIGCSPDSLPHSVLILTLSTVCATSTDKPVSPNYALGNGVGTGGTANLLIRLGLRIFLQNTHHEAEEISFVVCDVNSEKQRLQVNFSIWEQFFCLNHLKWAELALCHRPKTEKNK